MDTASLETQLHAALPAALEPHLHELAATFAGVLDGSIADYEAQERLGNNLGLEHTLRSLAGASVTSGGSLIQFGPESQVGDISIGDVAGGNLIKISVNFPLENLIAIGRQAAVFELARGQLLAAPHSAAEQLGTVLAELRKIYTAIDGELSAYLALFFDAAAAPGDIQADRNKLLDLQSGQSAVRIAEARGSCAKIMRLYGTTLAPWFAAAALPDAERDQIAELFQRLDMYDGVMVQTLHRITEWLVREAERTLDLVDEGQLAEANARVRLGRKSVLPSQRELFATAGALIDLQVYYSDAVAEL
jgi:hypothetical protein